MPAPPPNVARYLGGELALFEHATNWKAYYGGRLQPYLNGQVGAGLGGTTQALATGRTADWLCLEPATGLAAHIRALPASGALPAAYRLHVGAPANLPAREGPFDAAIGHFRRYSRVQLRRMLPAGCYVRQLAYLDSLGLLGVATSQLLRQTYPNPPNPPKSSFGAAPLYPPRASSIGSRATTSASWCWPW